MTGGDSQSPASPLTSGGRSPKKSSASLALVTDRPSFFSPSPDFILSMLAVAVALLLGFAFARWAESKQEPPLNPDEGRQAYALREFPEECNQFIGNGNDFADCLGWK